MVEHDHKGYSEEKCTRCSWVMGRPAINCQNDDTPHHFPSQDLKQESTWCRAGHHDACTGRCATPLGGSAACQCECHIRNSHNARYDD